MNFFDILTLFGGLAMFLYGMRLMGDSLKESSSGALKVAMEHVTNNPIKAFLLGVAVTAIIQSSTATIVITSGLVAAGILSLHQSMGIIIGANVGTTVTGQIIRLLDLNASGSTSWLQIFQPSSLAPIALMIGMILIMAGKFKSSKSVGNIAIGFGILFSGLLNMTSAVDTLAGSGGAMEKMFASLGSNPVLGYLTGAAVAFVLQSSSAAVGILQAFSQSGVLHFNAIYAVIVGIYLGDCVTTAIVCSIGAEKDQKRVGIVNILFNFGKSAIVLIGVTLVHHFGLVDSLWNKTVSSGIIANANTVFNLCSAILLLPLIGSFEKLSYKIVKDNVKEEKKSKYQEKIEALNSAFFDTPALALNSCYDILLTIFRASRNNIHKSIALLNKYDEKVHKEISDEEILIDRMTDRASGYIVELLPHLQDEYHTSILDQYYKVVSEFESLGDYAVHIADIAQSIHEEGIKFSDTAKQELKILEELLDEILSKTELTFEKRDIDAAYQIEPLTLVSKDLINVLKANHLKRMSKGQCDSYIDVFFTNLLIEMKRISEACSNVGVATVIRVKPEVAKHEHHYYSDLHSGVDQKFNDTYDKAHESYFKRLNQIEIFSKEKNTNSNK